MKKSFIIYGLGLMVFGSFGYMFGLSIGRYERINPFLLDEKKKNENTFVAGWSAARDLIAKTPGLLPPGGVYAIEGRIQKVSKNSLIVLTELNPRNPLSDAPPSYRSIILTKNTRLIRRNLLTEKEFAEAQQNYMARFNEYRASLNNPNLKISSPPLPVSRYSDVDITLEELKSGFLVTVQNASKDIEYEADFEADSIYLLADR